MLTLVLLGGGGVRGAAFLPEDGHLLVQEELSVNESFLWSFDVARNDPRVPASEADQMVATLRKRGTPVWYLLARDEGYSVAKKRNADFLFYAQVAFMRTYLLD